MEHPEVLLAPKALEVKEKVGQRILDNKITITIDQLLKLTLNLNTYLMATNKQSTPNEGTTSKAIVIIIV
jgi:hypothetical protein